MSEALLSLLPEHALGTLPPEQAAQLQAELGRSPALARELDGIVAALVRAAEALPPVAPDPSVRARLLRTLDSADRFAPFVARLTGLLDLTADAVRKLLTHIDDAAAWEPGLPGMEMQHFAAGPRLATADAGFVRLQPGQSFPRHRHLGPEVSMVLEGAMCDGDRVYGPGQVLELAEGSEHSYSASSDRPLVLLTVHNGIQPVF
jgi:anti-sigma factor ChrR (cupin superfamily)